MPRRPSIAAAHAAIAADFDRLLRALAAEPDREAAFRAANDIARDFSAMGERFAACRAELAANLWPQPDVKLADLAERLGVSPGRVSQLVAQHRERQGDRTGSA